MYGYTSTQPCFLPFLQRETFFEISCLFAWVPKWYTPKGNNWILYLGGGRGGREEGVLELELTPLRREGKKCTHFTLTNASFIAKLQENYRKVIVLPLASAFTGFRTYF